MVGFTNGHLGRKLSQQYALSSAQAMWFRGVTEGLWFEMLVDYFGLI
jgi:hypothetical protein